MTNEDMRLDFHNAVTMAFMNEKPLVVVEGIDDPFFYTEIARKINPKIQVKPIEHYKNCSSGCHQIERSLTELNRHYSERTDIYEYILGIVDRDTKEYRNEIKNVDGLFYLNKYSFESLYINKKTISYILKLLTRINENHCTEDFYLLIINKINENIENMYYITLEALKKATTQGYDAEIKFSESYENTLKNQNKINLILSKKIELDAFAIEKNLGEKDIFNLSYFCKGKWLIDYLINDIIRITPSLRQHCGDQLEECDYHPIRDHTQCVYDQNEKLNSKSLKKSTITNIDNAEYEFIETRMRLLAI